MFTQSEKSKKLEAQLLEFMDAYVYPSETRYHEEIEQGESRWAQLPVINELKEKAKAAGLWNLFVPPSHGEYSPVGGLSYSEYAPLAEIMGRVHWCSEVFNCSAPDTGNMEVFMNFGTDEQKDRWLYPLLNGDIRSAYAMTEPQVASSDATNVELDIKKEGNEWVLNGRKWFTSGAMHESTKIFIVMGKSDAHNPKRHLQQSQVLVPKGTPGLQILRPLTTFGYDDAPIGHAELRFENVRVPLENIVLGEGRGFDIAQSRLGPGRMHHCMRLIGACQRALELACKRVTERSTYGRVLSKHQSIREDIAKSFSEIEMLRLLVLKTCYKIDEQGVPDSVDMIGATKITVPIMAQNVIDRCMQMFGGGGFTEDFSLAQAFAYARIMRQADGPDQVHQMSLGKKIIDRYSEK